MRQKTQSSPKKEVKFSQKQKCRILPKQSDWS